MDAHAATALPSASRTAGGRPAPGVFPGAAFRRRLGRLLVPAAFLIALPASAAELRVRELRHPDGSLKERYTYELDENGQESRQGPDEEFYPGGAKKGVRQWRDGRIEGAVVYYHPNGRKSYETNYVNGRKNGFATVWYMNGQKQWETTFKEGKTHGRWREWYLDGRKKVEATYSEGVLDGAATWWHDNGRPWHERTYQSGVPVKGSAKEWDKAGRQVYPPPEAAGTVAADLRPAPPPEVTPPSTVLKIENPR